MGTVVLEIYKKRREDEALKKQIEALELKREALQTHIITLREEHQKAQERHCSFSMFLKDKAVKDAEREERRQLMQLRKERAEMMARKQKVEHQVQRLTMYWDILQRTAEMSGYKDAKALADHLWALYRMKEELRQSDQQAQEQLQQLEREQAALDEKSMVMQKQESIRLRALQSNLREVRAQAKGWEVEWERLQQSAVDKEDQLAQVKFAVLNLYEMIGGAFEQDGVTVDDTDKQLDKIKIFIQDHQGVLDLYKMSSQHQDSAEMKP